MSYHPVVAQVSSSKAKTQKNTITFSRRVNPNSWLLCLMLAVQGAVNNMHCAHMEINGHNNNTVHIMSNVRNMNNVITVRNVHVAHKGSNVHTYKM